MDNIIRINKDDISVFECPEFIFLNDLYRYFIFNQYTNLCCSVTAIVSLIEYLRQKEGKGLEKLSVAFLYHNALLMEGIMKNSSIKTKSVLNAIMNSGTCTQERWSSLNDFRLKPSEDAIRDALSRVKHCNIEDIEPSIETIKYIIGYCKRPIVVILTLYQPNALSREKSRSVFHRPVDTSKVYDKHSVLLVGYDDREQYLLFQNSFGEEWGFGGFGKISYDYIPLFSLLYSMDESCIKNDDIEEIDDF